ncbi:MAG: PAS domain S-box protein [Deltaproteobacteria bacterium]|nr:PAS domain S-box protein [Candidatus Zymogenaceae bacterium]
MHRVLIVDDSELILAQLSDSLTSLGFEVAGTAATGAEAIQAAGRLMPDLVMMDILMPGLPDGIDAARTIKETLDIPVIFLSAAEDDATLTRARAAGAYGFISKPGKPAELSASIEIALKKKESERELAEIFRDVVENTNDLVYVVDGAGRIKYVNERILEIGGYTKEDAIGRPFASFLTPASLGRVIELFKEQVQGKEIGPFELEVTDKFGNVRIIESRERLVWEGGRVVGVHGIGRDVSDRRRVQEELVAAREQYRMLVENAVEGIAVLADGLIKYANPTLLKLAGYPDGGLIGLPFIDLVHPDDRQEVMEGYRRSLAGETEPRMVTRRYLNRHGSVHTVENTSMPITWEGRPAAIVLINDVTETLLAERLLKSQRDIGVFLATTSDLAGALAGIMDRLLEIPGFDCGGIYLVDEMDGALKLAAHRGLSDELVCRVAVFEADTPEAGEVYAGKMIIIGRAEIDTDDDLGYLRAEGLKSLVVAPVFDEGKVVGSINISTHTADAISTHVVGTIEDIAERLGSTIRRIKKQEQLAVSEKKYRTLIENAKEGIVVIQDGVIKYVNPNAVRISGYPAGELVGIRFPKLIYPEDRDRVAARYAREVAGEDLLDPNVYRVVLKDGSIRWVEGIGISIDWEGRPASLSFIEDVTEKKLFEDALLESEQKFRSLFETSRDFLYIAAPDGTILDYNRAGKLFFGYTDEEIRGLNLRDLYANPTERDKFVRKVVEKGFIENYEIKLKKKDGTPVDALVTVVAKKDDQGNVVGLQGNVKDITQMRRLERQLLQTEKLSSLGTMISGIAHELNNPLTAIMGNAEILGRNQDLPPDIVQRLDIISKESVRTSKIISSLLSFAREHKPERRPINLNDCIMESHKIREYNLKVNNIEVDLTLSDELRPAYADPYQIQQVFVNIINNARDALMEKGGGTLAIRSLSRDDSLIVEFEDDGPGIEPENLKRIFDPFFTTKEVGKGTGLGLSMAYGIVKEHRGTIEVTSEPGRGAKFTVTIPVAGAPTSGEGTTVASRNGTQIGERILIVEDEDYLRDLLLDVLKEKGYEVRSVPCAEEAITLINEEDFDAVITDIKMPGVGGVELYRYAADKHPKLAKRMLFVTGDILSKETRSFLTTTDCVYIEKPFRLNDMLEALAVVLER